MHRSTPYALTGLGLVIGLVVLLSEPFPTAVLNVLVGGGFLGVAVASVTGLIAAGSGPDDRRPNF